MMHIKESTPFLSRTEIETAANSVLDQYADEIDPIHTPPVPVEKIADLLLELSIDWLPITDTNDEPILAYLDPATKTLGLNERRLNHFEQYPGSYEFTLAHEIGHYLLHLTQDDVVEKKSSLWKYLYRDLNKHQLTREQSKKPPRRDRREWQAETFASYLLLPDCLLMPAIARCDLCYWPNLYRLREQFQVSITALTIRLQHLGQLYITDAGQLYPSKEIAFGRLRQTNHQLISQANFYCKLGAVEEAKATYHQALKIARELEDKRSEAHCAWALGRLYMPTDPDQAAVLMSICVAYERAICHPDAEANAALVAQMRSDHR